MSCNMNNNMNCNMSRNMNQNMNRNMGRNSYNMNRQMGNSNCSAGRNTGCSTNRMGNSGCNANRNTGCSANRMGNSGCMMSRNNNRSSCGENRESMVSGCNAKKHDGGCDMMTEPVDSMMPAMSYVPWQEWKDIYCFEEALERGTIFKELDKPFLGRPLK